jgi:hypothetical protein
LDGQNNVTINGNTTLTWLPNGYHNVTVYATDEFGNTGVSKIIYFNVDAPFPTALIIAASVASSGVIAVGLLGVFQETQALSRNRLNLKRRSLVFWTHVNMWQS